MPIPNSTNVPVAVQAPMGTRARAPLLLQLQKPMLSLRRPEATFLLLGLEVVLTFPLARRTV